MADRSEYQRWYKTKSWRELRALVLLESPVCTYCAHIGLTKRATVVDHIRPHRGDPIAFWDVRNLQSLCKRCHDSHKQKKELTGILIGNDTNGWPVDPDSHWNRQKNLPDTPRGE